ncbi:MAG: segregation/condensation protein A [Syntrophales bacterium]|jgi:segregation and condensation protein A|nr:segregation/condensation protein A [Syntrophales bacterium]MCK9528093.1 segregation/condensation protein A [Syntrophales bacterium]MDX9922311.1 segregation/condensation protein A [Syntrophales bacterium]
MDYRIKLDIFEGPLDLLLYLIRKHEIDIYDIPISLITEQYISHIDAMKSLNLDLAGEYLVLAATLLHIKSRMLLPVQEVEGEEEEDPRAALVRQLLEYQAFREAALDLGGMKLLGRDTFTRNERDVDIGDCGDRSLREIGVFELVEAFQRVAASMGGDFSLEVNVETMSLSQRISEVLEALREHKTLTFEELLAPARGKRQLIYTFLALLELMKMRVARAFQGAPYETIRICLAVETEAREGSAS